MDESQRITEISYTQTTRFPKQNITKILAQLLPHFERLFRSCSVFYLLKYHNTSIFFFWRLLTHSLDLLHLKYFALELLHINKLRISKLEKMSFRGCDKVRSKKKPKLSLRGFPEKNNPTWLLFQPGSSNSSDKVYETYA